VPCVLLAVLIWLLEPWRNSVLSQKMDDLKKELKAAQENLQKAVSAKDSGAIDACERLVALAEAKIEWMESTIERKQVVSQLASSNIAMADAAWREAKAEVAVREIEKGDRKSGPKFDKHATAVLEAQRLLLELQSAVAARAAGTVLRSLSHATLYAARSFVCLCDVFSQGGRAQRCWPLLACSFVFVRVSPRCCSCLEIRPFLCFAEGENKSGKRPGDLLESQGAVSNPG
jgi:hypothetical protein